MTRCEELSDFDNGQINLTEGLLCDFFMIFMGGMSEKMYKMLLIGLYSR